MSVAPFFSTKLGLSWANPFLVLCLVPFRHTAKVARRVCRTDRMAGACAEAFGTGTAAAHRTYSAQAAENSDSDERLLAEDAPAIARCQPVGIRAGECR